MVKKKSFFRFKKVFFHDIFWTARWISLKLCLYPRESHSASFEPLLVKIGTVVLPQSPVTTAYGVRRTAYGDGLVRSMSPRACAPGRQKSEQAGHTNQVRTFFFFLFLWKLPFFFFWVSKLGPIFKSKGSFERLFYILSNSPHFIKIRQETTTWRHPLPGDIIRWCLSIFGCLYLRNDGS